MFHIRASFAYKPLIRHTSAEHHIYCILYSTKIIFTLIDVFFSQSVDQFYYCRLIFDTMTSVMRISINNKDDLLFEAFVCILCLLVIFYISDAQRLTLSCNRFRLHLLTIAGYFFVNSTLIDSITGGNILFS